MFSAIHFKPFPRTDLRLYLTFYFVGQGLSSAAMLFHYYCSCCCFCGYSWRLLINLVVYLFIPLLLLCTLGERLCVVWRYVVVIGKRERNLHRTMETMIFGGVPTTHLINFMESFLSLFQVNVFKQTNS